MERDEYKRYSHHKDIKDHLLINDTYNIKC